MIHIVYMKKKENKEFIVTLVLYVEEEKEKRSQTT